MNQLQGQRQRAGQRGKAVSESLLAAGEGSREGVERLVSSEQRGEAWDRSLKGRVSHRMVYRISQVSL